MRAERLAQEGLRTFDADEVVRVGRHVMALGQNNTLLLHGLAEGQPPRKASWQTFLVLASERAVFFDKALYGGRSPARLYGDHIELILQGRHLVVGQSCASGEEQAFMQLCRHLLYVVDREQSPKWELKTLALTPVSLFEASDAHAQGTTTSIMQHGPPAIPARLTTRILFVLSYMRSGSSLLQLCLQCHLNLYAGQEL